MKLRFLLTLLCLLPALSRGQTCLWAHSIGGPDLDEVRAVAVDASGNVYAAGWFSGMADLDPGTGTQTATAQGAEDLFLAKLDAAGNLRWAHALGGAGTDQATGIGVDAAGNVYLTGFFSQTVDFDPGSGTAVRVSSGSTDLFLARYDSTGALDWVHSLGAAGTDEASALHVNPAGTVQVTGTFSLTVDFDAGAGSSTRSSSGGRDVFFMQYDNSGTFAWAGSLGTTQGTDDAGLDITADGSGNVYLSGSFEGTCDFDPGAGSTTRSSQGLLDAFFAKYDASGNLLWVNSLGGEGNDYPERIRVDGAGNVVVAGEFTGSVDFDPGAGNAMLLTGAANDLFYARYSNAGAYLWARALGSGLGAEQLTGLDLDGQGNLFLSGHFTGTVDFDPGGAVATLSSTGSVDVFLGKYRSDGTCLWAVGIGGPSPDLGGPCAWLPGNGVILGGKYQQDADFQPGGGSLILPAAGLYDGFVARYQDLSVHRDAPAYPGTAAQPLPNPAHDHLRFTLDSPASLRLCTLTGQELHRCDLPSGPQELSLPVLPQGLYLLHFRHDAGTYTRRLQVY